MDFNDSPEEADFRAECRTWLAAHATPRDPDALAGATSILGRDVDDGAALARAREWQQKAAADRWAGISWPVEHGGRGASFVEQIIWQQEAGRFDVPDHVFRIGIAMGGPTVIAHGTPEQCARWLPPLLSGEEIWCQLFSEPAAGSDLAGLRTTAVRDGSEWVVNGQKVWSSGAHYSRRGMLLARTDPEVPKHAGITYFMLDMDTPGIDVRPLRQMTGGAHFNEVFFTDVRIPDADRLGDANDGWRVAQTTLLNERAAIADLIGGGAVSGALTELARRADEDGRPGVNDRRVRQAIARVHIQEEILRFIGLRIVSAFALGRLPGPEASVAKLAMAEMLRDSSNVMMSLLGAAGVAAPSDWATSFLAAPAVRIAGGSDEVQRNIIGERVLGLPKSPGGPARDTPFASLPA